MPVSGYSLQNPRKSDKFFPRYRLKSRSYPLYRRECRTIPADIPPAVLGMNGQSFQSWLQLYDMLSLGKPWHRDRGIYDIQKKDAYGLSLPNKHLLHIFNR